MNKPKMLEFTKDLAVAVADYYEYTMAHANIIEGIEGKETVFDLVVRQLPSNMRIGNFEYDGVKYDKLAKRPFLINAGLEQAAAYFLEAKGNKEIRDYMENVQNVRNKKFLDWTENIRFKGDVYAMKEGTVFFGQETQVRVHDNFETSQVFESLLLNTINPQTNVASTANDIAGVCEKILLEGGSRRATSPQSSVFNSRAARIGGFTASSNIAYGMIENEKVGGTHGHSYVMLHPEEYEAFKAQSKAFGDQVCFLLDTYNVKEAFEKAVKIANEDNLNHIAFRIDSGNLYRQALWIHQQMREKGYSRKEYTLVASDDLTAGKIADLEKLGADIDKYLAGTYLVSPAKPVPGVFKLAAYKDNGNWIQKGKLSENSSKSTLPGVKQIYRVTDNEGFFARDIIAFEGEDITKYLEKGDSAEELLIPIIKKGEQVYSFPTINEISDYRKEQLSRFRDINSYEVIISDSIRETQNKILEEHNMLGGNKLYF